MDGVSSKSEEVHINSNSQAIEIELFRGECCEDELGRLSDIVTKKKVDVLVGMGGGKTIDSAKIIADRKDMSVIIVPTIASTDAPCSGFAVLYSNENHIVTPALDHIIAANILLSGIGFESAGLASAHSIHNGLTALTETHSFCHGEKVAFGVLAELQLTDATADESTSVFSFCKDVGLPTTLADNGLGNADREKLMDSTQKACAPEQPIHHEAEAELITPEKVLNAIIAPDAIGRSRKKQKC
jgi:glycerol dehydrogenase-like iron-containing ADH family enzyme